jgi:hypothetical protein
VASVEVAGGRGAAEAIARRSSTLSTTERRRLGRWASAALRDPRASAAIAEARNHGQEVLSTTPERKRRWQRVSAPLYEGLVAAAAEDRRYKLVMLGGHFVAILAVVNVANGLALPIAIALVLAAPASAWIAWGRATAWLGAIDAALGAELVDQLDEGEVEALQRAWRNSIEEQPPVAPPLIGAVSTFLPSVLLVVVLVILVVTRVR